MNSMNRIESSQFVRTSVRPGSDRFRVPDGAGHPMSYGDRIFVRVVSVERGWRTVAELTLTTVADMSEVYGELRHHTRGERGLTRLYVRNATRGWSFEQPFMLYGETRRVPAASVTHAVRQPEGRQASRGAGVRPAWERAAGPRQIPAAVAALFD